MKVTLDIPDNISFQLIYRLERRTPFEVALEPGLEFVFLNSLADGFKHFPELKSFGGQELASLKGVAKLVSASRSLYLVTQNRRVLSYGWGMIGKCNYYKIEKDAVVIGPIWTSDEARGKGLATRALQLALNEYVRRGRSLFYIDTEKGNYSAQRVFEKCGFGLPVALYFR